MTSTKFLGVEIPPVVAHVFTWVVCSVVAVIAGKLIDTPYQADANAYREKKLFAYAESLGAVPGRADRRYYGCTIVNKGLNPLRNFDVRITLEAPIGDQSYRLSSAMPSRSKGVTVGERFLNHAEPRVVGRTGVTLLSRGDWVRYGYYVEGSDLDSVKMECKVDPESMAGLLPAEAHPPPPGFDIYMKIPRWSAWLVVNLSLLVITLAIAYFLAWLVRVWPRIRWKQ